MNFSDYIITKDYTVSKALSKLQENEYKLLFLEDEEQKLAGVVTDGDIRRFLLAKGDISQNVEFAIKTEPFVCSGYHEGKARKMLIQNELICVPMVKEDNEIHALVFRDFTLHKNISNLDVPVIIMAGGFGTRLKPFTNILPKPLIPVGEKTITEQIIDRFYKFGCKNFSFVVNYKKNLIKAYFAETKTNCEIEFIDEDKPLGTGGGLAFYKGKIKDSVFVTNCDSVIEADYSDIFETHKRQNNAVTMVCAEKTETIPYGVVETDQTGALCEMREKPKSCYLMNTGFYIISKQFLDFVNNDEFQPITDIIMRCKQAGHRIGVYKIDGECFVDIGQLDDLQKVEDLLK